MKLPEHRNGYWYRRNGTCVKPGTWECYRYTYSMAILHLLGYATLLSTLVGVIVGIIQLWIWYPNVATPIAGTILVLMLLIGMIQGIAKDITRT